jgi:HEPN superfamily AbiU2-like protein
MSKTKTKELENLKAKREEWLNRINAEDRNSIQRQICSMIWDAAVFRVINESRRLANNAKEGGVELNGMVHNLIDKCFFQSQMTSIRRLLDKSSPAKGPKAVYSIHKLLSEIERNINLFTRGNMFAAEEMLYDYESVQKKNDQYCKEQIKAGNRAYFIPQELDWHCHERRHKDIDRLSGVDKDNRSPNDTIKPEIISHLISKLDSCKEITDYVDKYIAHAATPESRATIKADEISLTLRKLWDAHETICKVTNFVSVCILGDNHAGSLDIPQYDHFAFIDRPLIESDKIEHLHELWNQYEKETRSWGNWGIEEIEKEMKEDRGIL